MTNKRIRLVNEQYLSLTILKTNHSLFRPGDGAVRHNTNSRNRHVQQMAVGKRNLRNDKLHRELPLHSLHPPPLLTERHQAHQSPLPLQSPHQDQTDWLPNSVWHLGPLPASHHTRLLLPEGCLLQIVSVPV